MRGTAEDTYSKAADKSKSNAAAAQSSAAAAKAKAIKAGVKEIEAKAAATEAAALKVGSISRGLFSYSRITQMTYRELREFVTRPAAPGFSYRCYVERSRQMGGTQFSLCAGERM
jgi:hypothetical protein